MQNYGEQILIDALYTKKSSELMTSYDMENLQELQPYWCNQTP